MGNSNQPTSDPTTDPSSPETTTDDPSSETSFITTMSSSSTIPPPSILQRSRPPKDNSSLSNPQSILVTHLHWVVHVDFETSVLTADATYDLHRFESETEEEQDEETSWLFLDTNHLVVDSVQCISEDGTTVSDAVYELEPDHPHLGRRLKIFVGNTSKVRIHYRTTAQSAACQWLPPSQTAGKERPFMFTQCQAIHARSLVPCQDQPGVKMTYSAEVTVPLWSTCVLSALHQGDTITTQSETTTNTNNDNDGATTPTSKVSRWNQPVPISSYLLALAIGDLTSLPISPRVKIWSEPSVVQAAAYEFAHTEQYVSAAEQISDRPYAWGRYDLLCLPPSFPYGGMENPCLTFVTPTLLAGDRSLADVVAHEVAHSWTGNLVTNATWEHFWLNEGWTMWLQRKIVAKTSGGGPTFVDFDAIGGWKDLEESVREMPEDYTRLVPLLGDGDPDDAFSSVPYEKGFNLLYFLETLVGTEGFESFFKDYIKEFASLTVTSEQFRDFFLLKFPETNTTVDWDVWFHAPGLPPSKPNFDRTLSTEAENLARAWVEFDRKNGERPDEAEAGTLKDWSSDRIVCFLNELRSETEEIPLKVVTVTALDGSYGMSKSQNSEILFRYCILAVAAEDESVLPVTIRFITSQGRMKFVRPLYRALFASRMGKKLAVDTFVKHADFYHPICAKMVAGDLKETEGKEGEEEGVKQTEDKDEDATRQSRRLRWWQSDGTLAVAALVGTALATAVFVVGGTRRR